MVQDKLIKYDKTVLRNGLRVITEKIPSARSISIGVWIDVGSRDEEDHENGISHFIEHMLFKGTKTRSAKKIASWLESLGGNLNAFTSREHTCYHAIILDEHLEQAVDILADLVMNATLTARNIEKEKLVVAEEIHEVRENPSDYIHEIFADSFWRGQPLGKSILGSGDIIRTFSRNDLKDYMARHYRAKRIVIAAAGNISHRRLIQIVREKIRVPDGNGSHGRPAKMPETQTFQFKTNNSQQNHVCLGFPGIPFEHADRYNLIALYTYLGLGMSSVLFQKIREERGIAYSIYTFADFFRDSGVLGIYFGTERKRLQEAIETTFKELKKIKKNRLPDSKMNKIKAQIKGHLTLSLESTIGRMSRLGRLELLSGKYTSLEDVLKSIDMLKSEDLIETARKILRADKLTVASLGPASKEDIKKIDFSKL
jgi:predicted Zn-dependent peptidase